jgi:hypothetical protein
VSRIAPKGGYDFARKRDYRRKVWATFRDGLKSDNIPVAESHALLMPSLEGAEIDVALNAGFREKNLHIVDLNPAIVATLKRRYPQVNSYGCSTGRAMGRIAKSGVRLRCANFDFTGRHSVKFAGELSHVAIHGALGGRIEGVKIDKKTTGLKVDIDLSQSGAFDDICFVAVSAVRGREERWLTDIWASDTWSENEIGETVASALDEGRAETLGDYGDALIERLKSMTNYDRHRLLTTSRLLGLDRVKLDDRVKSHPFFVRSESYLSSNNQTMMWSIWKMISAPKRMADGMAADLKRCHLGMELRGNGYVEVLGKGYDTVAAHLLQKSLPLLEDRMRRARIAWPHQDMQASLMSIFRRVGIPCVD